ncbi:MAG TPA: bifunctional methionine sulfoxide reductase B/A protein [Myxococcota bacterium]|nr:bifunctional methionine sulfoxide reductase B/A protein [Myxococcota bacterium]
MRNRKLTPEEVRVIERRGTEAPFGGKYDQHFETGVYSCKRCGAALFLSEQKFKSSCGWPSFDGEIPGAVERRPDLDGVRTEIVCARCGAHLGHVFEGENLTPNNLRHCVNSISMEFIPAEQVGRAIFAGGCFWGVEYRLERAAGVISTTAGYTGGAGERPSYEEVCTHTTGHAEAVEVLFDRRLTSFEELARLFFEIHDPTQLDRQGPDIGDQYRSEIFYFDQRQKDTAQALIDALEKKGLNIATRLEPATTFWSAEDYHQDYYRKNNSEPYCHIRTKRF